MTTALITGLFALSGVFLGVLLEPVKALLAARRQARNELAAQCVRFAEEATAIRSIRLRLNILHRRQVLENDSAFNEERKSLERDSLSVHIELSKARVLLQLKAPVELVKQVDRVREADRILRAEQFIVGEQEHFEYHVQPSTLKAAATALEYEIEKFVTLARRYCC